MEKRKWFSLLATCAILAHMVLVVGSAVPTTAYAQTTRTFPQTGKTVKGEFLQYWNTHGGLAQQGYPISEEMQEVDKDGVTRTTQYFERAVFELHPEYAGTANEVLLSLLGVFYYDAKYHGSAPGQKTSTNNPRLFDETGFTVGGVFRKYWETHGGLAQQGYPISEEFQEVDKDGVQRTTQYFQRAVFEYHEEYAGTANEVLLSLLGVFYYGGKSGGGGGAPEPSTPATPSLPSNNSGQVFFYNSQSGYAVVGYVEPFGAYRDLKVAFSGSSNWTHIIPVGNGRLLFYRQDNGDCVVGQVATDGTYSDVKSCKSVLPAGLTHIATTGHGLILTWTKGTVKARSLRVDADGTLTGLYSFRPEVAGSWVPSRPGWTHMVGLENGVIVFFERGQNMIETVLLNTDGSVTPSASYDGGGSEWTHLVAGAGNMLLKYYSVNGNGRVIRYVPNEIEHVLAQHPDPSKNLDPLPRGIPIVASMPSGLLLFYNDSDGSIITGRMTNEGVVIYERGCCGATWTHVVGIR